MTDRLSKSVLLMFPAIPQGQELHTRVTQDSQVLSTNRSHEQGPGSELRARRVQNGRIWKVLRFRKLKSVTSRKARCGEHTDEAQKKVSTQLADSSNPVQALKDAAGAASLAAGSPRALRSTPTTVGAQERPKCLWRRSREHGTGMRHAGSHFGASWRSKHQTFEC